MSTIDKSKARWPDGMKWDSPTCIIVDNDTEIVNLTSDDLSGMNSDFGELINRYRFAQIEQLPKMVEFHKKIKAMSEKECDHTWFPDEILEENDAILREIGEVE